MSTYATIKDQIAKLEAQANEVRAKEVREVVDRIRAEMEAYGLTPADIGMRGGGRGGRGRGAAKAAGTKTVGVPKYRDPETGRTWTGHGKPPNWIAGKDREGFLISGSGSSGSSRKATGEAVKAARGKRGAAKTARKAAPRKAAKSGRGRKSSAAASAAA